MSLQLLINDNKSILQTSVVSEGQPGTLLEALNGSASLR